MHRHSIAGRSRFLVRKLDPDLDKDDVFTTSLQ
jgi:hypothetical protein